MSDAEVAELKEMHESAEGKAAKINKAKEKASAAVKLDGDYDDDGSVTALPVWKRLKLSEKKILIRNVLSFQYSGCFAGQRER